MNSLILLIDKILNLVIWIVVIQAVLSWLIAFDVINFRNRFVFSVHQTLGRLTRTDAAPDSSDTAGYRHHRYLAGHSHSGGVVSSQSAGGTHTGLAIALGASALPEAERVQANETLGILLVVH